MIPILFEHSATNFDTYGIGSLVDAVKCTVSMKEAQYELQMVYPVDGEWFSEITQQRIIYAKPCQTDNPQPFRIYRITKPIGGKVTVYARHISYDLIGIPILPFKATSAVNFAAKISQNAAVSSPFTFTTNIHNTDDFEFFEPRSARSLLLDGDDSMQGFYGGEFVFDKFWVRLRKKETVDRGVVIRYGVDLVDAKMEENISETYTGILPYYWNEQSSTLVVGTVLTANGSYLHTKILPVNLYDYILEEEATQQKVNEVGQTWLEENLIGYPKVNLSLSYAQIDQTVRLYDTITVKIEKLGIDVIAKVTETVYDVLNERYDSIVVGDPVESIYKDIYDASRLKTGLLDMKRIKDESITSSKMGSGSVGTRELQDWSIIRSKLAEGAVGADQIENGSIIAAKIADQIISLSKCDSTIRGFFDGTLPFSLKANSITLNGRRFYIGEHGEVMAEAQ